MLTPPCSSTRERADARLTPSIIVLPLICAQLCKYDAAAAKKHAKAREEQFAALKEKIAKTRKNSASFKDTSVLNVKRLKVRVAGGVLRSVSGPRLTRACDCAGTDAEEQGQGRSGCEAAGQAGDQVGSVHAVAILMECLSHAFVASRDQVRCRLTSTKFTRRGMRTQSTHKHNTPTSRTHTAHSVCTLRTSHPHVNKATSHAHADQPRRQLVQESGVGQMPRGQLPRGRHRDASPHASHGSAPSHTVPR